ncbi:MAG: NAD-dependent epimerase/dehydratase family protein [Flavobacteriales bacterium]|nr:NAD-dependent epimerase/dehydratase family protein [Flavobacteriales bacterium]
MKVAITGSSGFIGSQLTGFFIARGDTVVMMQRQAPKDALRGATFVQFDLRSPKMPEHQALDAVIHCAVMHYSPKDRDAGEVNISATLALRDLCRSHGIPFIFLSTMSAHAEAESVYGRHKFRLEQMLDAPNETVLKLGLVVGAAGGLFQRISRTIGKSPLVPLVDGGMQPVQTIAIEDVCMVVAKVVDERICGQLMVASEEVITLRQLYQQIARSKSLNPFFLSLPYALFNAVFSILAILPLPLPISKENLLGLKHLRSFDTASDLHRLGVRIRPLDDVLRSL